MPSPTRCRLDPAALVLAVPRHFVEVFRGMVFIADWRFRWRSISAAECLEGAEGCLDPAGHGEFEDLPDRLQEDGDEDPGCARG